MEPIYYKNKCNFDVEIHDEVIHDLDKIDMVYLVSGDSDFVRTKERVLSKAKKIKFLSYKVGCAWELKLSWHVFLDDMRKDFERKKILTFRWVLDKPVLVTSPAIVAGFFVP